MDKDAGEAAQLCQEMLSSSLGLQGAGASGRQAAAEGTREASALGRASGADDDERDGRAAPFLQTGMLGAGQRGKDTGKARLPGMGLGRGKMKGGKRGAQQSQDANAPASGFYTSIYDLIHVSMTVWVGAAILLLAGTMLLVKRSPLPALPGGVALCARLRPPLLLAVLLALLACATFEWMPRPFEGLSGCVQRYLSGVEEVAHGRRRSGGGRCLWR